MLWIWTGQAPYGSRHGRYYGFNLLNWLSAHYSTRGEIALQVGSWFHFWKISQTEGR